MSSLIERANRGNFGSQEKKQHWKYEWYTPSNSDITTNASNSNTEGSHITKGGSTKKYSFQYKTWMRTDNGIFEGSQNKSTGDLYDLTKYSGAGSTHDVNIAGVRAQNGNPRDEGLTVEDIRGAVGDSEAIPGFSNSDAAKEKVEAENSASIVPDLDNAIPEQTGTENLNDVKNTNTSIEKGRHPVEIASTQPTSGSFDNNERTDVDGDLDMQ